VVTLQRAGIQAKQIRIAEYDRDHGAHAYAAAPSQVLTCSNPKSQKSSGTDGDRIPTGAPFGYPLGSGNNRIMKSPQPSIENSGACLEEHLRCSQCGWPGIGTLPVGVRMIKQDGKTVLVGQLSYYRASTSLCSVCQAMQSAVVSRQWFIDAHTERLDQVKVKKQLLGER